MPIKHAIWKVGDRPQLLPRAKLASEQTLEDMIVRDPSILSNEWMLIGRQESTSLGGRIDLLAIAPDASLVLIELKRNRTPREVVAQALDYATWVEDLTADRIARIFHKFSGGQSLDTAFRERFGQELNEDELNASHQIILVAAELDDSTERIIGYLNERDIAINVILFQVFQHGADQLLSRAWLIDPGQTQENVTTTAKGIRASEPWNGEFYVSFGDGPSRSWREAADYGFISAGGGAWYSRTLRMLNEGDRVWVNVPAVGYVGVGRVKEAARPMIEFEVKTPEGFQPATKVLQLANYHRDAIDDPENSEWFVTIEWLETVPIERAFSEIGLFGNQNSVCKPTTPLWRHTVERLKERFTKWNC